METSLRKQLEEYRKSVAQRGEEIVFCVFPKKILELTELSQTTHSPESPFHISNAARTTDTTVYPPPSTSLTAGDLQTRKRKLENREPSVESTPAHDTRPAYLLNRVLANKHIVEKVHKTIKKESEELAMLVDQVKLWVTLALPKIEDGDNFGVQIQEEVLLELHRAQESANTIHDIARQHYVARAMLCSKLIKYPNVEDYKLAIQEHDEKQLYLGRQHLHDLRNVYATITDLIHKNISKIRAPKANNSVALY